MIYENINNDYPRTFTLREESNNTEAAYNWHRHFYAVCGDNRVAIVRDTRKKKLKVMIDGWKSPLERIYNDDITTKWRTVDIFDYEHFRNAVRTFLDVIREMFTSKDLLKGYKFGMCSLSFEEEEPEEELCWKQQEFFDDMMSQKYENYVKGSTKLSDINKVVNNGM